MTTTYATETRPDAATPKRALAIAAGLLAAAVILAIIVAVSFSGSDNSTAAATSIESRIPQGDVRQVSFAEVSGAPLPEFAAGLPDEAIGMVAPGLTAAYFDNVETTIATDDGTARVILFLAHWCPHCQAEVTAITTWLEANELPDGVDIIPISTSVDQGSPNYPPSTWFLRENLPVPVLRDSAKGDLAAGYGLTSFPYLVAVDGNGKVVSRSSGSLQPGQWEAIIASLSE